MTEKYPLDDTVSGLIQHALKLEKWNISVRDIEKLFSDSGLYAYPRKSHIVRKGEKSRDIYIICSGKVAITRPMGPAVVHLVTLGPGDIFGEIALLHNGIRRASAVASEDSRIFRVACSDIQGLLKMNPALAEHLTNLANQRLAA
ncbi:MAG: cyclic nucleotide-binding domain-containing protein [bacterium]